MTQFTFPIIVAGIVIGAVAYTIVKPKEKAPSYTPKDPDQTGSSSSKKGPGTEPGAEQFQKNPNELVVAAKLVEGIAATPGATLADKMATCTFPVLDTFRVSQGGEPVNRCWRDRNPSQTEVGWITNMAYWSAYPRGPELLQSPSSQYSLAWKRINGRIRSDLATAGLI
jgi:hypothetical protein